MSVCVQAYTQKSAPAGGNPITPNSLRPRGKVEGREGQGTCVGWGWGGVGSQLVPKAGPTACASLPLRHDLVPTSGCLVSQPPRLLTVPKPHQGAGGRDTAVPVCVSHMPGEPLGGFRPQGQGTVAHLCSSPAGCGPPVGGWGRLCVPGAPGPSSRAGEPYTKAAGGVCGSGDLRLPPAH